MTTEPKPSPGREGTTDAGALAAYSTALTACFPWYVECSVEEAQHISTMLINAGGGHAVTSESGPRRIYLSKYSVDLVRGGGIES